MKVTFIEIYGVEFLKEITKIHRKDLHNNITTKGRLFKSFEYPEHFIPVSLYQNPL